MDISQLNIATTIFLRQLRLFSEQNIVQINEKSAELFMDVIQNIEQLIATSHMIPVKDEFSTDFLLNLNEKQFDLKQYIMCRMCNVSETKLFYCLILFVLYYAMLINIHCNVDFVTVIWNRNRLACQKMTLKRMCKREFMSTN